jgi:hypothetical protein
VGLVPLTYLLVHLLAGLLHPIGDSMLGVCSSIRGRPRGRGSSPSS